MRYRVRRADPSGNITLFVLDPVERAERPALAARLMELPGWGVEQVGFVCPPRFGGDGRFEMMGGEFCGNAARAFGMLLACDAGLNAPARLRVEASGCEGAVDVDVDPHEGTARASMPLPRFADRFSAGGADGVLVDLGGIVHFVTWHEPDAAVMDELEPALRAMRASGGLAGMEAYGVIFLHGGRMTPLVKVPAAGTLVWEGSCGSGSIAAAVAESLDAEAGAFAREYVQPAGAVRAEVERRRGRVTAARIGGVVALDGIAVVEL